ncbi:Activator of (R)-2-hydroxyglutaryl-CoA dehydratase [hydrothermal vent metagenome]|uniref:Activator of (R)-2-hydroxyglutaryl-CoA dehydratase n=1 Tax=hydrothermal vent metagenome TaxID=652676 RepID=A0A3B0XLH4_9ZZZZ
MIEQDKYTKLFIGIDVGSTTVKCVVMDTQSLEIIWQDYQRHETRQAEKLLEMLEAIQQSFPGASNQSIQSFITGSGAGPLKDVLGAVFVQEVNAVALAVEQLYPDVNSVVELGGQDAKIINFDVDKDSGERQITTSMNDKCASGTGATIDKCFLKVGMKHDQVKEIKFNPEALHHVAAKCGVFAETDIVNLIKSSIPSEEVMNSLADAIVMQNLSVLTRGSTLKAKVLLLGGPNAYLPFLQECWRLRIPQTWAERGYNAPDLPLDELIIVPDNGQYFAAFGAVIFGKDEPDKYPPFRGASSLRAFIEKGRQDQLKDNAGPPLVSSKEELDAFLHHYTQSGFKPVKFRKGTVIDAYIGIDGGSTSSKAVMIDENGEILAKEYQLSKGNPIQDTREILQRLKEYAVNQGCELNIKGFGATGYAADVLEKSMASDTNLVETVAHMISAKKYCGEDIDVVCDVGGQDIKVLFMENGQVKNFRLSNQCSAGNGMLLQAMADQFGININDYASTAFSADISPEFSYGCAVFLDTDRVNFQKEGFAKHELFSGLARVLPKNIWQYVVQIPRMAELGNKFVLQGGTQYNMAALKAQVDYIKQRVPNAEVILHPHNGEAGAIGAALETRRQVKRWGHSTFIGLDAAINLHYTSRTDESTRCTFCDNNCSRTFIDTRTPTGNISRYIAGFSCEKGTVESKEAVVILNKERRKLKKMYPNLVDYESHLLFKSFYQPAPMPEANSPYTYYFYKRSMMGFGKLKKQAAKRIFNASPENIQSMRESIRIGIPKALNIYTVAPFMLCYLQALGLKKKNIVFSEYTSEELWKEGGKYGSIDPCFPSKVIQAHIHNLMHKAQRRKPLNAIWYPSITHINSFVSHTIGKTTCPIVAGSANVVKAAFTKEKNFFGDISYCDAPLNFVDTDLLELQLFQQWQSLLQLTGDENRHACQQALKAMNIIDDELQQQGMEILQKAEQENSVALLLLGRPYHNDPGLNHEILEEFQTLGYPVLSIRSIPKSKAFLEPLFKKDLDDGLITDVYDIRDVWPENFSVNSCQKVWAAKFAARHPNVAVLDLSSFKCGHDAPTYGIIDKIMGTSNTPYMAMHEIDANKPSGSIKIRVKTYAYTLQLYREKLLDAFTPDAAQKKNGKSQNIKIDRLSKHSEKIIKDLELAKISYLEQADTDIDTEIKIDGYTPPTPEYETPNTVVVEFNRNINNEISL